MFVVARRAEDGDAGAREVERAKAAQQFPEYLPSPRELEATGLRPAQELPLSCASASLSPAAIVHGPPRPYPVGRARANVPRLATLQLRPMVSAIHTDKDGDLRRNRCTGGRRLYPAPRRVDGTVDMPRRTDIARHDATEPVGDTEA
jgi:hypothetical protein